MPFVLAQIRLGVKVLKPWYGFVIRDVATLTDVFASKKGCEEACTHFCKEMNAELCQQFSDL